MKKGNTPKNCATNLEKEIDSLREVVTDRIKCFSVAY